MDYHIDNNTIIEHVLMKRKGCANVVGSWRIEVVFASRFAAPLADLFLIPGFFGFYL